MSKKLLQAVTLTGFLFSVISSSNAQEGDKYVKQQIRDGKGNVSLITFNERAIYKTSDFKQVFKDQLGAKEDAHFQKMTSETDKEGFVHEKYQLFHKGVKVEFATYSLHSKQEKLVSLSGEFYSLENIEMNPVLTGSQAFDIALRQIGATAYLWENDLEAGKMGYAKPEGELVLLPSVDDENEGVTSFKLAYKFDIYATNPVSRGDVYIDAFTGNTLFYNATIKHIGEFTHGAKGNALFKKGTMVDSANSATRYSGDQNIETSLNGSNYVLADNTRGLGVFTYNMQKGTNYSAAVNFTDADNNWTAAEFNNANKDNGALDAHWGAGKTYDYLLNAHGRNGYNNDGAAIKNYVHYSNAYNNAYWNGSVMTYGDGSGVGGFNMLTSLDVAAHEIGHALCSSTANLAYQKESGALNEALSDIWAACVEYFAAPSKQIWLIGEDIEMRTGHVSLRSMSNPKAEGQPDTYGGTNWKSQKCVPTSNNDYCGVHTNSGVLNHWFYILTEGKTGTNDLGNAYSVTGIGINKAANIVYRLETVYLTSNATYASARTYGIQAATDLFGANSPEVIATTNAFYAVGVGAAYVSNIDTTAPSAPINLIAAGTTQTSTNLTWSASTDNISVTGYNVYQDGLLIGTSPTASFAVTSLAPATNYLFTVKAYDAAGNLSSVSNTATATTLAIGTYCNSKGNDASKDNIAKVVFNAISNNSTSTNGYENFTGISTDVLSGSSYTVTITPNRSSKAAKEGYAVFIDLNADGDFVDSGETVWSLAATNASVVSGTIRIPGNAVLGNTRMRVSMKLNGIPTACETLASGQVEDYTVNVISTNPVATNYEVSAVDDFDVIIYPNPVENYLQVIILNNIETSYSIVNQIGQEVKSGKVNGGNIDVSDLTVGIYFLRINGLNSSVSKKFIKK
ncbi:peptidase M4, thermolysin [Flavobacterium enshiense DK69]|uniref:Peptidase M4 n=1 Tax=Flavobacterium enshiense DK69 TaxID=1107311 RepID=V6SDC1_9FLAO|nr:M4 family metallopeptidase [Flavobacterium enshiense]ESU24247.1 peptidase M4, thermolysin [Flavobacterium enshiense DK69]KGO95379.1 peptidase M4 [Flavobacterium enshiense DK69]